MTEWLHFHFLSRCYHHVKASWHPENVLKAFSLLLSPPFCLPRVCKELTTNVGVNVNKRLDWVGNQEPGEEHTVSRMTGETEPWFSETEGASRQPVRKELHAAPGGLSPTPLLLRSRRLSWQPWRPLPHPATVPWAGCFAQSWNYPNPLKYMAANEDTGKKGNNCDSNSRGQAWHVSNCLLKLSLSPKVQIITRNDKNNEWVTLM